MSRLGSPRNGHAQLRREFVTLLLMLIVVFCLFALPASTSGQPRAQESTPEAVSPVVTADSPQIIYVEVPADPDGLTLEQILMIGLFCLLALSLWVMRQNNVTAAMLLPLPLVQEVVRSAVTTGLEAARIYAVATPNQIDDALVRFVDSRVHAFFNPPPGASDAPPGSERPGFPGTLPSHPQSEQSGGSG